MLLFWFATLALAILLYVVLDGFDLGVGILFGLTQDESQRARMVAAISPVWDGNETWLIIAGTVLFGAFPRVYALLLSAFYLSVMLMLAALILRGVAFEFRHKATRSLPLWNFGMFAGSLVASFMQGTMVGALARGLPIDQGCAYVGGPFGWCSLFALLCGAGLCIGYALLGSAWLAARTDGELQQSAMGRLPWLTAGVLIIVAGAFAYALREDFGILQRWLERPWLAIFPGIGLIASLPLLRGVRLPKGAPLGLAALLFTVAFGMFAASFWPDIVPFHLSLTQSAAPRESLSFMFWGAGLFVLPLVLAYNVIAYRVFAGAQPDHH